MTQAHKTIGAIVVLRTDPPGYNDDMAGVIPNWREHRFEVLREEPPGHLHVRSVDDPEVALDGWHDDRFVTYRGKDLAAIQKQLRR